MLQSLAFDAQRRKTNLAELLNLVRNCIPVDRLVSKKMSYLRQSLPVVDSLNGLLALFRLAFKPIVEFTQAIETNIKNHKA